MKAEEVEPERGKAVLSCRRDGSSVTVIVMCAWLAVADVPPAVHCRNTGFQTLPCVEMAGKPV